MTSRWRVVGWSGEGEVPFIKIAHEDMAGFVIREGHILPVVGEVRKIYLEDWCAAEGVEESEEAPAEMRKLIEESCDDCEASGMVDRREDWRWPAHLPIPTRWRTLDSAPHALFRIFTDEPDFLMEPMQTGSLLYPHEEPRVRETMMHSRPGYSLGVHVVLDDELADHIA